MSEAGTEPMRWLGVDPGSVRVGVAACDPEERVAVPIEIVPASAAFPAIRAIARREEIGGIVIGLPRTLEGAEGEAARAARKLGDRLMRLGLPIEYEDERLTSVAAERGMPRGESADDVAAALLLQQFIDRRRSLRAGGPIGETHDAVS
ncbi:MAG: Holliday junction resolvase RuvX [Chloroflexi bacterium]|nr:Holliday junction resolvase RuvX [Chloroflexota bacterium]